MWFSFLVIFVFIIILYFEMGAFGAPIKGGNWAHKKPLCFVSELRVGCCFPASASEFHFRLKKKKTNLRFPRQQHGKAPPKRYFLRRRDSAGKADPPEQNHLLLQLSSPSVSLCSLHFLLVISLSLSLSENLIANLI